MKNKPKANLYMLIKIEVDDDKFPDKDILGGGWYRNKRDTIQKYIADYYNITDEKLPIRSDYGEYWIEGESSDECKWEICDDYHLHYDN